MNDEKFSGDDRFDIGKIHMVLELVENFLVVARRRSVQLLSSGQVHGQVGFHICGLNVTLNSSWGDVNKSLFTPG